MPLFNGKRERKNALGRNGNENESYMSWDPFTSFSCISLHNPPPNPTYVIGAIIILHGTERENEAQES